MTPQPEGAGLGGADDADACPDPEVIGAYVEGSLSPAALQAFEAHLAGCQLCCSVIARVAERAREPLSFAIPAPLEGTAGAGTPVRTNDEPGPSERWWAKVQVAAGALAVAALLTVVVVRFDLNPFRTPTPHEELVAAVGSYRTLEGRLSGFEYGPLRSPTRGNQPGSFGVRAVAARMEEEVGRAPTADNLHVLGLAQLQLGDVRAAILTLEAAASRAGGDSGEIYSDLAAAYLAADRLYAPVGGGGARFTPGARAAERALQAADRALESDPARLEAHFNRVLSLEALGRGGDAAAARRTYLQLDSTSPWADEVRNRVPR